MHEVGTILADFVQKHNFDGLVIEIWSQLGGARRTDLAHLITHIADALHAPAPGRSAPATAAESDARLLVLVIPPPVRDDGVTSMIGSDDVALLAQSVDYFSIMTYDYSIPMGRPGPNSPLLWIERCVSELLSSRDARTNELVARKLLLGVPFYGYDMLPGDFKPILVSRFLEILKEHRPSVRWNVKAAEHSFEYATGGGQHLVVYPTLPMLRARLDLALGEQSAEASGGNRGGGGSKGVAVGGISIWELGQGPHAFFDLL